MRLIPLRHLMFLLSLVAALAGTPLRIVEAASDLARSFEVEEDAEVETVDGAVGDDSEVAVKAVSPDVSAASPSLVSDWFTPVVAPTSISGGTVHRRSNLGSPSGSKSPGRLAWLQCFRC